MLLVFRWLCFAILITFPFCIFSQSSISPQESNLSEAESEIKQKVTERVSILRDRVNATMQNSAQWFDQLAPGNEEHNEIANAKGYVSIGFAPRARDILDFDNQFKVSLTLPKWEERLKIVIDNDEDEEDRLPFQSASRDEGDNNLNAALNWYMVKRELLNVEHRVGFSRGNLYGQSRLRVNYLRDDWTFSVTPSIEYYLSDGWGSRVNTRADWQVNESHIINFSFNARYVESEPTNRVSAGMFHSQVYDSDTAAVTGFWASDGFSGERSYYTSYRVRTRFYEQWLFLELEPFIEFRERYDFDDEPGIAIRLIGYYGH